MSNLHEKTLNLETLEDELKTKLDRLTKMYEEFDNALTEKVIEMQGLLKEIETEKLNLGAMDETTDPALIADFQRRSDAYSQTINTLRGQLQEIENRMWKLPEQIIPPKKSANN